MREDSKQHSELLVHPKTGRRLGTDERPCETCGKPHVERMKSPDGGYTTWADPDDGHIYKPLAWRTYLQRRVRDLEEQLQSANERKQELWTRLLDMENKYLDTHEQLQSAQQEARDMSKAAAGMSADVSRFGKAIVEAQDHLSPSHAAYRILGAALNPAKEPS